MDRHIRYFLFQMCLDIEHYLKVRLLNAITTDPEEDGYNIVRRFIKEEDPAFRILKSIDGHKSGTYCKDLIEKYYPVFPVWVFVELISFGDLIHFCSFYDANSNYKVLSGINNKFLNTVRDIRNACGHSNCMLNTMFLNLSGNRQADTRIRVFVSMNSSDPIISRSSQQKYLKNEFTYNLLTVFYVYSLLVPETARKNMYDDLSDFIHGRMCRNARYFVKHDRIKAMYEFWVKFIDNLHTK